MEALWGQSPPPTAQRMLHNQVFALRKVLGRDGRLETHGSAYRLNVGRGERDVDRFEELVAAGRASMETDPERAAETLRQALGLWRGDALSDLAFESFAQTEIARLEERRWATFEAWSEAELALGRHADLVAELEAAVAAQPLRERLHGQLMLALYRSGRQAEALEAYRAARATLVEEIGVEPSVELRALQAAILAQDAALDPPPGPMDLPAGLAGGSPTLAGRTRELAELVALLAEACDGRGGLVFVSGPRGIGKTRLAQELARDALRRRMVVLYTAGGDPPTRRTGGGRRTSDSAHRGRRRRRGRRSARSRRRAHRLQRSPAAAGPRAAPAARATGDLRRAAGAPARPRSPRERRGGRDRPSLHARRAACERRPGGGERRRPAGRASPGSGMGAGAGVGGDRRDRGARHERARRPAVDRGGALRRSAPPPGAGRPHAALPGRRRTAGDGVSLPGARHVRRGPRRVLLRSRAPGGRAGRPARGLAAGGRDRTLREREVLGGARRAAAGARRWRAARIRALAPGADAPGAAPHGPARARAPGARRACGARGRPVRGGVHGLPRR